MPNPRVRSVLIARLSGRPHGSSQSEILDELRRCILDGEVPPGSPIPVDGVAASFGVSRIPVREALMCAAHHHRLQTFVARLPQDTGLFSEEQHG